MLRATRPGFSHWLERGLMTHPDNGSDGAGKVSAEGETHGSDDLKARSDALDKALAGHKAEADAEAAERLRKEQTNYAQAFRLSSEFIAGIVAGGGIGFLLDALAGTSPWGLIVFLLLGFGAGVFNVLRSAGLMAEPDRRIK